MTTRNLKLKLAVISEFSFDHYSGGGEKRYHELTRRLVKRGHQVTWITMRQAGPRLPASSNGVKTIYLGTKVENPPRRSVINFLTFSLGLLWHLTTNKYDVIDAQTYCPLAVAFMGTLFKRKKLVATIHDVSDGTTNHFNQFTAVARAIEGIVLRLRFRTIVTVSHSAKSSLVDRMKIDSNTVKVVYNGVDLGTVDAVPTQEITRDLIFIGRLVPHKGVEDFVSLCQRTGRSGAVVGQGPLGEKISAEAAALESVEFIGRLQSDKEVIREIKRSRLLVLPSVREGFGIVLAEAGAAGRPAVAYNTGGVREVIVDGVTGCLVPCNNIEELCAAVERILSGNLDFAMGRASRHFVETHFTWDKVTEEMEAIYLTLCE